MMLLDDFDFVLPEELIAQQPAERRDSSRLMLLDRHTGETGETRFSTFPPLLDEGDVLVVNDTKVIPARLFGKKDSGGRVEIFLSRGLPSGEWECLLRCSKPPKPEGTILLPMGVTATVKERSGDTWRISFSGCDDFMSWLQHAGTMPLPPYIRRESVAGDRERYQTVFASAPGAVAAPTAGLHFTEEVLDAIRRRGVTVARLTLHVGLGTFLPVRDPDLTKHRMHRERYFIPAETAKAVAEAKGRGRRVIAVGTTATRALEHAASLTGEVPAGEGEADIFIYPGYRFRVVDALVTNFHLPKSTLLLLVSALAGRENILAAYSKAVEERFRFFSYGDAMFIR